MDVIDDFLPSELADALEATFLGKNFPWFYHENSVNGGGIDAGNFQRYPVLRHCMYDTCNDLEFHENVFNDVAKPMLDEIVKHFGGITIYSVYANLMLPNPSLVGSYGIPHSDGKHPHGDNDCITALYYVNDTDGPTILYNESYQNEPGFITVSTNVTEQFKIEPKKNRFIWWNANQFHSAPSGSTRPRCVVNFNYKIGQ